MAISITPVYVADLLVDLPDVHMPVWVHVIEHPEGRILVESEVGRGSVFTLELPRVVLAENESVLGNR